ncbi:thioester reductase domain-containing protein [Marininema mesophilum]|uniref:Thioester reductase domain-containing protein n=1 Tax=Marininema mesophilum TaxID=1048340 RepID=A0A1H3B281_9BACL|nr:type I polyketide synthase [Marininema mesophilum]SDX35788.1 thioester reductase domain-containing protein [Marininema mesophilum]
MTSTSNGLEIAIVGMACRFPGGSHIDAFWENLKNGVESVTHFSDEELRDAGIDWETIRHPEYVKAGGAIAGTEWFDHHLFGYSPREAEVMDPQVKVLHECAWEALEHSGYATDEMEELVGVYIGSGTNLYWMNTVFQHAGDFMREALLLNSSQFFSTRLSHQLNLKGPSYTVQTACSSSLVAVHLAAQALLSGDCDMALAGGVSITLPEKRGYFYQEGMIMSPDGHCRPFDAGAKGTVNGNGAGVVVLKRLEDAIAAGDNIYAVVKGTAINNDGADKISFTAPSVDGQAEAIRAAHQMAEVEPESISYVETHGTGTVLGDPIEVEGLKVAFHTNKRNYCALGSVKANIGHLDNAAGIAGFIKTALSLKHRLIPSSINFEQPNEKIDFANSPFYVNTQLQEWRPSSSPLRAGVSSFGIGGTNAHAILEEAPDRGESDPGRSDHVLALSAQSKKSLDEQGKRLLTYLEQHPDVNIADIAYTLLIGRKKCRYNRTWVVSDSKEAKEQLSANQLTKSSPITVAGKSSQPITFLFPGQGSQYPNMGRDLYREEKVFREEVDRCCAILQRVRGDDFKEILFPTRTEVSEQDHIHQTMNTQPAVFIFEYALAKTLMSWGIRPDRFIGHSVGEYVAACLSGVLSLENALRFISTRAELMQGVAPGSMVSVMAPKDNILPRLKGNLSLAVENAPSLCVVAGPDKEMEELLDSFAQEEIQYKKLITSHAFHSAMMEPILHAFREKAKTMDFHEPKIPYISNVTGTWITSADATDPEYWVTHLRQTVQFSQGVKELLKDTNQILLEVGPGRGLSTLVRQHLPKPSTHLVATTVPTSKEKGSDYRFLLQNIAKLHASGVKVDWMQFFSGERRFRIPLPTYPFDRQLFRIQPQRDGVSDRRLESTIPLPQKESTALNSGFEEEIEGPPLTATEQKIMAAYREVTGVQHIKREDDFFDLGGSSLTAVNVVARLQKEFHLSINDLFEYPRPLDLAEQIQVRSDGQRVNKNKLKTYLHALRERIGREREAQLNFGEVARLYNKKKQVYQEKDLTHRVTYSDILLTGSTGYLGSYLLRDLLHHTESCLHLIVRSDEQGKAEERVKEKLAETFGSRLLEKEKERIFVYCGDLTKADLGLDTSVYQRLSETIQCVMHAAANVSHYGKYEESYVANSLATQHLIDFASVGRSKDFNHISTLAVASGQIDGEHDLMYTEFDHDLGQVIDNPYPKTKLDAEKMLMEARGKGLKVNIFRVGNIAFDSTSGKFQKNIKQNAIYSIIQSYVKIGWIPEMERDLDFSCIDDVSQAIISLFDKEEILNETHHICNPEFISLSELLTYPSLMLEMKKVAIDEFIDYVFDEKRIQRYESDIYNIQVHSIGDEIPAVEELKNHTLFHIRSEITMLLLEKMSFQWNPIDEPAAQKMIQHCRDVNLFEMERVHR